MAAGHLDLSHLPLQSLLAALPRRPVGDGRPSLPSDLRLPTVRENSLWEARQSRGIARRHPLHDWACRVLAVLQLLLRIPTDLHVSLL